MRVSGATVLTRGHVMLETRFWDPNQMVQVDNGCIWKVLLMDTRL